MPTFNQLPFEIRAMIWKSTVEPRTVEVRVLPREEGKVKHLVSLTPVPAPLQTCREARNLGLYKQAFAEVEASASDGKEERYVWLNLELDVVSIGPTHLSWFRAVAPSIRRLQFACDFTWGSEFDFDFTFDSDDVHLYANVEQFYAVCTCGMEGWRGNTEQLWFWPFAFERLTLIDPFCGRVVKAVDMDSAPEVQWRKFEDERQVEEARERQLEERQLEEEEEINRT